MKLSTQFSQSYFGNAWFATTFADGTKLATAEFDSQHDAHVAAQLLEDTFGKLAEFLDNDAAKRARQEAAAELLASYTNQVLHGKNYTPKPVA